MGHVDWQTTLQKQHCKHDRLCVPAGVVMPLLLLLLFHPQLLLLLTATVDSLHVMRTCRCGHAPTAAAPPTTAAAAVAAAADSNY
jgi:hypothetical protein